MKKNKIQNAISLSAVTLLIFIILAGLQYIGVIDEYNGQLLTLSGLYIIISLSLNLITGFTGQLALGHAGFMCIGAYSTAVSMMKFGVPLLLAIIIGGLMTAVFGIIIGFPTLRLRGDYLAIATLGFGIIIQVLVVNLDSLTGGAAGLKGVPSFANTDDFVINAIIKFTWVFVFAILTIVIVKNFINSSHGRAVISIREDEIAANSMGINTAYYKMLSFTLSAFLAGLGGGLYAVYFGYLNPSMFGWLNSVNFVVIIVLGGLGSITGTILASVGFTYTQEWLRELGDFRLAVFGLALIIVMIFWPNGLMGTNEFSIVSFIKKVRNGEITPGKIKDSIIGLLNRIGRKKSADDAGKGVK